MGFCDFVINHSAKEDTFNQHHYLLMFCQEDEYFECSDYAMYGDEDLQRLMECFINIW